MDFIDLPSGAEQWSRAFPVLQELRPELTEANLEVVLREGAGQGLRFFGAFDRGRCLAVAGYRLIINTSAGRKLYVDDLVVTSTVRSQGTGTAMFTELVRRARELKCVRLELDSGVQRFGAHRFYLHNRMQIRSHHFSLTL